MDELIADEPIARISGLNAKATAIESEITQARSDGAAVESLLKESRAAHLAYRYAMSQNQTLEAKAQLAKAARLRSEAAALDPEFLAPCWSEDARTHPHVELLDFYAKELAK